MEKAEAISRLRTIRLRIDEIACLVAETDADLGAIQRIRTVQADLRQVHDGLLDSYLEHCFEADLRYEDRSAKALEGVWDAFRCMNRSRW